MGGSGGNEVSESGSDVIQTCTAVELVLLVDHFAAAMSSGSGLSPVRVDGEKVRRAFTARGHNPSQVLRK